MSVPSLRVSRLYEQDFMRISSLDIRPGNKTIVILKGPNEQGKTSAIRAMISALAGKSEDPERPIRAGATSGSVEVVLADHVRDRYRVRVAWTPSGRYLSLRELLPDGGEIKVNSPQTVIEGLITSLSFSPLRFKDGTKKEQIEMLFTAIGKRDYYETMMKRRAAAYDTRTGINSQLKAAKAQLSSLVDPAPDTELQEMSAETIRGEIEQINERARKIERVKAYISTLGAQAEDAERQAKETDAEIERLRAMSIKLRETAAAKRAEQAEYQKKIETATAGDTSALSLKLQQIQEHNARRQQQIQYRRAMAVCEQLSDKVDAVNTELATIDSDIRNAIMHSELGTRIRGLSVSADEEILYDGIPLSQASGMRQLEVSAVVGMCINRPLRIMCIDEGDRLDEESLKRLKAIAESFDFQLWMTAIYAGTGADDECIIRIMDGASPDSAPPPPNPDEQIAKMMEGVNVRQAPPSSAEAPIDINSIEL